MEKKKKSNSAWISKLPLFIKRSVVSERCVALDSQGYRCKRIANIEDLYHGDGEIYNEYNEQVEWVRIALCEKHFAHHDPAAYKLLIEKRKE